MTATGHALVGTVIAAKVGNPALPFPSPSLRIFYVTRFPIGTPATTAEIRAKPVLSLPAH